MNELVVADETAEWFKLKALVLDRISSPITRHFYSYLRWNHLTSTSQDCDPLAISTSSSSAFEGR